MARGDPARTALRWAIAFALLGCAACDALDRGLLDPVVRPGPDDGVDGALDGGPPRMDGGMPPTGGAPAGSGGYGGGGTGGTPHDGGWLGDAQIQPAGDSGAGDGGAVDAAATPDAAPPDLCPDDPNKTAPGECGCGQPETQANSCAALRSSLRHRYRFDGTGSVLEDSAADADGTVVSTALDGSGALTLAGGTSNQHVDLPDGMISALSDATFEVWLSWAGGAEWQRVLDFGNASGASGQTYLFITPRRGGGSGNLRVTMSLSGTGSEVVLDAPAQLPAGGVHHLALVVADQSELRLYLDGVLQGSVANTRRLSQLNDVNNWLGRSNYSSDDELGGTYHELRIHGAALSAEQIAASFGFGPDPAFLD